MGYAENKKLAKDINTANIEYTDEVNDAFRPALENLGKAYCEFEDMVREANGTIFISEDENITNAYFKRVFETYESDPGTKIVLNNAKRLVARAFKDSKARVIEITSDIEEVYTDSFDDASDTEILIFKGWCPPPKKGYDDTMFRNTKIRNGYGYICVPDKLYKHYVSQSYWLVGDNARILNKIVKMSDFYYAYPESPLDYKQDEDDTLIPSISNISCAITVKALTYYDGYWYGVGNDSNGAVYKLYGTTTDNLTAVILSFRNYPVTGMICDGVNVLCVCGSGPYNNKIMLYQPIESFRSGETNYKSESLIDGGIADGDYCVDVCATDTRVYVFGGLTNYEGSLIYSVTVASDLSYIRSTCKDLKEDLVSGCAYKNNPVAVTAGGQICLWSTTGTAADANLSHTAWEDLKGAQKIRTMGDYLCVASAKDDGMYLSFTTGNPITDGFSTFKIDGTGWTIVDMVYAGGLYNIIGRGHFGDTRIWQSADLKYGVYIQPIGLERDYPTRAVATDGTNICILGDNGTDVQKAIITIPEI